MESNPYMKKKHLRKKLAEAESLNNILNTEIARLVNNLGEVHRQNTSLEARIAELETDCDRLDQESIGRSDTINSLQKQNKTLKEHVAYLERIKLYGKVTATDYVDASKEAVIEQPPNNKGVLGVH